MSPPTTTLEAQVQALAAQNLFLQASNLMNQQWMKWSRVVLEHKEKQAERKKNKEGNEVLRLLRGDAVLVTCDKFFKAKVLQEKEKKAKLQEKEDNLVMTKLWEEVKLRLWRSMQGRLQNGRRRRMLPGAREMTKKAYIESLKVFGEEEEDKEEDHEGSTCQLHQAHQVHQKGRVIDGINHSPGFHLPSVSQHSDCHHIHTQHLLPPPDLNSLYFS
ncbi:hypothetical protein BJ165DRAFT_1520664 [Panaeolus papilionaceus]|nr:hypothetical protein BJ165DRAFT_1520664 [Panaeolus papilionaceus]